MILMTHFSADGENDPPTPTDDEMDLLDSITLTSGILLAHALRHIVKNCLFQNIGTPYAVVLP
jgi:hypothetical protein